MWLRMTSNSGSLCFYHPGRGILGTSHHHIQFTQCHVKRVPYQQLFCRCRLHFSNPQSEVLRHRGLFSLNKGLSITFPSPDLGQVCLFIVSSSSFLLRRPSWNKKTLSGEEWEDLVGEWCSVRLLLRSGVEKERISLLIKRKTGFRWYTRRQH